MDGGGARGVTTVEILKRIEQITGKKVLNTYLVFLSFKKVEEMFDMICGTSAGGLVAVCTGMKKFSLDKVSALQDKLCYEVFARGITIAEPTESGILSSSFSEV